MSEITGTLLTQAAARSTGGYSTLTADTRGTVPPQEDSSRPALARYAALMARLPPAEEPSREMRAGSPPSRVALAAVHDIAHPTWLVVISHRCRSTDDRGKSMAPQTTTRQGNKRGL